MFKKKTEKICQQLGVEGLFHSFVRVPAPILDKEKVALRLPIHPRGDQRGGLLELGTQGMIATDLLGVG